MGLGDQIAQHFVEKRSINNLDFIRTAQFVGIGCFIAVSNLAQQNITCIFFLPRLHEKLVDTIKQKNLLFFLDSTIQGPATKTWYGILDKYFGSKGPTVALKKVACDQLLFAPTFIIVLLSAIGAMQGNDIKSIKLKLEDEYIDILKNNYKVLSLILFYYY